MKDGDYTLEEIVDKWEYEKNQYLLIENMGTIAERTFNVYDTEIEAYRAKKRSKRKIDIVKANITYITIDGLRLIYEYEVIE